jgi:uncharacterized protein (DUF58 family)
VHRHFQIFFFYVDINLIFIAKFLQMISPSGVVGEGRPAVKMLDMAGKSQHYKTALLFSSRFFYSLGTIITLFIFWYFLGFNILIPEVLIGCFFLVVFADAIFLFAAKNNPYTQRLMPERFSNNDWNTVQISITNQYRFPIWLNIIEELPEQFQIRKDNFKLQLNGAETKSIHYKLRPVERGEYKFGHTILLITSKLGMIIKKVAAGEASTVAVYPSFIQMRKYELFAHSAYNGEAGNKRVRKIGHSMEFEQIKEYVNGDDMRTINWKATARRGNLMVNHYTDEKSQQIFCIIDKGRLMKMPFEKLTLLDYAINATLVLSNVCLNKQDRVGLITFSNKAGSILAADRKAIQMENILQMLYKQQTQFLESDYEKLYMQVRTQIKQRSLLVLFTNFESVTGMRRQLPYLKKMASHHLLMVIFFENTELKELTEKPVNDLESLYTKTIAEKFGFEKKMIVKELANHGILSVLTTPQNLTINAVNKYLEVKARQII